LVFQYESLVGYLFVVNSRALSTPPPGALVRVAPKDAARPRAADTVYVLVTPSGTTAPGTFYENLAKMAVERYFTSSGSVTAGLRAVYDTVNRYLLDYNRQKNTPRYEVNMLCAVLHDDNLILSRCGMGVAVIRDDNQTVVFPTDPLDQSEFQFGAPLGVRPIPDMKFKQVPVIIGTRLLLSDGELADVSLEMLKPMLQASDVEMMLVGVKGLLGARATLLAAEMIPPDNDADPFMPEGDDSAAVLAAPLPPEKRIENVQLEPDVGTRVIDSISQTRDQMQEGMSKAAGGVARGAEVASSLLDHYFPDDDTPRWWQGPMGIAFAVGIPLVVVALVITFWLLNIDVSEYEICVGQTFETASIARSINSADVNGTLAAWNAVLLKINECDALRPEGIPDTPIRDVEREGQNVVDRLLNIDRRPATVLASFPSAQLSEVVLRGLTMYVLDDANDIVYELQMSNDGRTVQPNTQVPITNMRRGAPVNQFTVGDIIGIAWAEDGSALSQSNVLLAVDREGVVVEHSPTILTRGAQRLLGSENWIRPVAVRVWRGNLYILDPGANQIWRYSPSGGSYAGAPTEYFAGQTRPNISGAVDFSIDNNGAVYVMLENGQMGKYVSGESQTFAFANFPSGQQLAGVNAMYLSTSPLAQSIYITSQANRTVYEVTQAGTFMRSYRTFDEDNFASLGGVVSEPGLQLVYVLSGNSVFVFNKEG
jgi:hypothetical protein